MTYSGFFELTTPRHLLEKARRDLLRLQANPLNSDAAFDLFVTARHVPDWLEAVGGQTAMSLFQKHVELRICRHLADGAKHFRATRDWHKQVQGTVALPSAFQANTFQPNAYQTGHLEIDLDPADQHTLAVGPAIDAITLAKRVLDVLERVVP